MNRYWICLVALLLTVLTTSPVQAQSSVQAQAQPQAQICDGCDCYHFPIPERCKGCCGFDTGKIDSVTNSSVILSRKDDKGGVARKEFQVGPKTKKNTEKLTPGAPATIYHKRAGYVADAIDLVEALPTLVHPGHDRDPPTTCKVPPTGLKIFMGDSVASTTAYEATILRVGNLDVLRFHRVPGGVAIIATIFDEDGKFAAQIVDNRLYTNPAGGYRITVDGNLLFVFDASGKETLRITYLNPDSLRVAGTFNLPGHRRVVATDSKLFVGGMTFYGMCAGGTDILFQF